MFPRPCEETRSTCLDPRRDRASESDQQSHGLVGFVVSSSKANRADYQSVPFTHSARQRSKKTIRQRSHTCAHVLLTWSRDQRQTGRPDRAAAVACPQTACRGVRRCRTGAVPALWRIRVDRAVVSVEERVVAGAAAALVWPAMMLFRSRTPQTSPVRCSAAKLRTSPSAASRRAWCSQTAGYVTYFGFVR